MLKNKTLILMLAIVAMGLAASAQQADNYPPDNTGVVITSTNLPIVWIDVDGATIDRTERITARMKVLHNGEGNLNYADTVAHPGQHIDYDGYIALRYRGNTSFSQSPKKPYSLHTMTAPLDAGGKKQRVSLLGMPKDNNWALLAPYADKSMMRDLLTFSIARQWMDYAPQGRYCELYLDGTYYGVYILTEVVSKGSNRLNLDDPGEEGDELTGGYLMEVDHNNEPNYTSKYAPVTNAGAVIKYKYIHMKYKSPDYEDFTTAQLNYIHSRIDQMEDALASDNYTDPATGYRQYLDMQSFIDYQLVIEFSHNVDGYRLSAKFFKWRDSVDPRFKMVVWDSDQTYGNSFKHNGWLTTTWIRLNNDIMANAGDSYLIPFWWRRLNSDPAYTAALKARWAQYRQGNLREDRLMATIDSLAMVLTSHGAESRNSQAWPRWGVWVWPNKYVATSHEDEVNHMKQWITDRLAWMDSQLGYTPPTHERGDVNHDGSVDISDVVLVIDYVLTGTTQEDQAAMDVTGNGVTDISDVTCLINYILNGEYPD